VPVNSPFPLIENIPSPVQSPSLNRGSLLLILSSHIFFNIDLQSPSISSTSYNHISPQPQPDSSVLSVVPTNPNNIFAVPVVKSPTILSRPSPVISSGSDVPDLLAIPSGKKELPKQMCIIIYLCYIESLSVVLM
jgi:hypothetical protein